MIFPGIISLSSCCFEVGQKAIANQFKLSILGQVEDGRDASLELAEETAALREQLQSMQQLQPPDPPQVGHNLYLHSISVQKVLKHQILQITQLVLCFLGLFPTHISACLLRSANPSFDGTDCGAGILKEQACWDEGLASVSSDCLTAWQNATGNLQLIFISLCMGCAVEPLKGCL